MTFNSLKPALSQSIMSKRFIHCALTVVLSLWISTTTAHSQETQAETKVSQLRALAVGYENELKELEILDATLQSVGKLKLRKLSFSTAFTCPVVEGKLIFGIPAGIDEEGQPIFKPVASVNWKSSYREVCLIFIPKSLAGQSQGNTEYSVQLMDMSSKFKLGHTKILNLTPFDTMIRVGEHKTSLKPWGKFEIKQVKELTGVKMAQLDVFYKYNDTIHSANQSRYRYLERTRYITFIYPDIRNKRVAVNVVKDFGNLY